MSPTDHDDLLRAPERRFTEHAPWHEGVTWAEVRARLDQDAGVLRALYRMEATGGEPDVSGRDAATGRLTFRDCTAESPAGRRSLGYFRGVLRV